MRIGFVCCRIFPGWAYDVFLDLIKEQQYDEAKVFTLVSDRSHIQLDHRRLEVITVLPWWLNRFFIYCTWRHIPVLSQLFDYRNLMFFYVSLVRILSWKIKKYTPNKLVISSFAIAKNISVPWVYTMLYVHSPMQYIWSHYDEYMHKLRGYKKILYRLIVPRLRKWDMQKRTYNEIYANSKYTATLVQERYWLVAKVYYPHLQSVFFTESICENPAPYYIYMGRLSKLVKEVDTIIHLCNSFRAPLLIMGDGPDELYLKSIAWESIMFVPWVKDLEERVRILKQAMWLINITKESFGISTAEAVLLGIPVFWYNDWATPELVGKDSWVLVDKKDLSTLRKWFTLYQDKQFDRRKISAHARKLLW